MLQRLTLALFVLLVFSAGTASAQADPFCTIGVYADADGTLSTFQPVQGEPFDVYVVMFSESLVNAVALQLFVPGLGNEVVQISEDFGPGGGGLNIPTSGGFNIGLGECAVGFGGLPIRIARFGFLFPFETIGTRTINLGPNPDEDPEAPVFSDCQGRIYPCNVAQGLFLEGPVDTQSESFGAVKSLYAN